MDIARIATDVLIIGSGGAGMRAAIAACDANAEVCIASKGAFAVSGATVTAFADVCVDGRSICEVLGLEGDPTDSKAQFFADTVKGGNYLNDQRLVEALVEDAPQRVREMLSWGARVTHIYGQPGHSHPRGLKISGRSFAQALARQVKARPIRILEHCLAIGLAKSNGRVAGAYLLNLATGEYLVVEAAAVIIATGGAMNIFPVTTAPCDLVGDGQMIAYRAGADLVDMEFPMFILGCCTPPAAAGVNFPFALILRAGAHLYNREGERYMEKWDAVRKEKTTRDLLTVGTTIEILDGRGSPHGGVWTSLKHLPDNAIDYFFEWYAAWDAKGHGKYGCFDVADLMPDPGRQAIEARPSAHFWNGGIKIDAEGGTRIAGLFAAGEASGGVHGSNRLSGNAMTDIIVWGCRSGRAAAAYAHGAGRTDVDEQEAAEILASVESLLKGGRGETDADVVETKLQLQNLAWECVGPVRTRPGLERAISESDQVLQALPRIGCRTALRVYNREWADAISLRNMAQLIKLTALAAMAREESRGSHYRRDFPQPDSKWLKNILLGEVDGQTSVSHTPVRITTLTPEVSK